LQLTKEIIVCGTSVNVSGENFAKEESIPQEIANCVEFFLQNKEVSSTMLNTPSTIIDFSGEFPVTVR